MNELCPLQSYHGLRICVACSGGRDSVALLHYLKTNAERYGFFVSALTCEHGIRGESSLRDLAFVRSLCGEWNIPLRVFSADIPALAKAHKRGLEEEGRAFRYECFSAVLAEREADAVATAHHKDDLAETVLFRLARGTSSAGLSAIGEREGIVRPFLTVSRAQIDEYVTKNGFLFVEDDSNADVNFSRNAIRLQALPALERAVNGAAENLAAYAKRAAEDDRFLQALAQKEIKRKGSERRFSAMLPMPLFSRACVAAMKELGVERDYTQANVDEIALLKGLHSGKSVCLPCGLAASREGAEITIYSPSAPVLEEIPFCLGRHCLGGYTAFVGEGRKEGALFADLDSIGQGCVIRTRREGDRFRPFKGHEKTLKAYLTDKKIPAREGRKLPLIAKGNRVYAVFGVEISDEVKVTEQTKRVCALSTEKRN